MVCYNNDEGDDDDIDDNKDDDNDMEVREVSITRQIV